MCDLIQNRQVSQVYLIVYEGLQIGFPDVTFQFFFIIDVNIQMMQDISNWTN